MLYDVNGESWVVKADISKQFLMMMMMAMMMLMMPMTMTMAMMMMMMMVMTLMMMMMNMMSTTADPRKGSEMGTVAPHF